MRIPLALLLATGLMGSGPKGPYLGLKPPGAVPELFAPGVVCTGLSTRDLAMTPDGSELYFSVFLPGFSGAAICWTRQVEGVWTRPEVAPFSRDPRWKVLEPCVSPDGKLFLFTSDRPETAGGPGTFGLWLMERSGHGWGEPHRLPPEVNGTGRAYYASLTRDRTLYFLREDGEGGILYRARWQDGYRKAEPLPAPFNRDPHQANPFVDPDERFLIVPMFGRKDSLGGGDYYIHFRRPNGTWTEAVHLGAPISSPDGDEYSASLSPDGRYLFFGSARPLEGRFPEGKPLTFEALLAQRTTAGNGQTAIWWVDAAFLDKLREASIKVVEQ